MVSLQAVNLLHAQYFTFMFSLGQDYFSHFYFGWAIVLGGITALLFVEAIKCGNTLNLSVIFCGFLIANSNREFLLRLSKHGFWTLLKDIASSTLLGNRSRGMWRELSRVSQKVESNQPGLLTPSPAPLGAEPQPPQSCCLGKQWWNRLFDEEHSGPWGICTLILCVTTLKSQACKHGGDECVTSVWIDKNKINC